MKKYEYRTNLKGDNISKGSINIIFKNGIIHKEDVYYQELKNTLREYSYGDKIHITTLNKKNVIDIIKYREGFINLTKALVNLKKEGYISQFSYSNDFTRENRGFHIVKG